MLLHRSAENEKYPPDLTPDKKKAFEEYFQLIYWNKEIKTDKGRKRYSNIIRI